MAVKLLICVVFSVLSSSASSQDPDSFYLEQIQSIIENPEATLELCNTLERTQDIRDEHQFLLKTECDSDDEAEYYEVKDQHTLVRSETKTELCFKVKKFHNLKLLRIESQFRTGFKPHGFTTLSYEYLSLIHI